MKKTVVLLLSLFTLCLPASQASAYLIDTGPGPSAPFPGFRLYDDSSGFFQYLAGEFSLTQPSTITGIEGWFWVGPAGNLTFKIYNDDHSSGTIPGTATGFSQTAAFAVDNTPSWKGVSGLNWSLGPGTYWVAFEPLTGFDRTMPYPAKTPLINEAFKNNTSSNWVGNPNANFGVRIASNAAPLPGAVLLLGAGLLRLGLWGRSGKG